jgi:hypothetical protein
MPRFAGAAKRLLLASLPQLGVVWAATSAKDLSKYRNFQLGADLATIAKQVRLSPSQAKAIQRRPALIQELVWRAQPLGPSSETESASEVVFSFFDGELFRVAIAYDRYETEGLTADDFIESISATYGLAEIPANPANAVQGSYGDQEEIVARVAGLAILLRPDSFLVWPDLSVGWGTKALASARSSRDHRSETARRSGGAAKRCRAKSAREGNRAGQAGKVAALEQAEVSTIASRSSAERRRLHDEH